MIEKELHRVGECPFKCGKPEHHLRYLECENEEVQRIRTRKIKKVREHLERINVYGDIRSHIIAGLTTDNERPIHPQGKIITRLDHAVQQAVEDQQKIGWKNVRRGMISKKWATAQHTYIEDTKATEQYAWGQQLVKTALKYTWEMWMERNEKLHGVRKKVKIEKQLEALREKVDYLYERI